MADKKIITIWDEHKLLKENINFLKTKTKTVTFPASDFIKTISERGYIHQCTDLEALDLHCKTNLISAYIGFDCTADSLHVGSLTQIMMLRHLQNK